MQSVFGVCVCVAVCPGSNFRTKWPVIINIFVTLVHVNTVCRSSSMVRSGLQVRVNNLPQNITFRHGCRELSESESVVGKTRPEKQT